LYQGHIHVVVAIVPDLAVSTYVKNIKGSSSRFINVRQPDPFISFYWQDGFSGFSVSVRLLHKAIAYANYQKNHHADGTTVPILEQTE